jgi:hypothetical protein
VNAFGFGLAFVIGDFGGGLSLAATQAMTGREHLLFPYAVDYGTDSSDGIVQKADRLPHSRTLFATKCRKRVGVCRASSGRKDSGGPNND